LRQAPTSRRKRIKKRMASSEQRMVPLSPRYSLFATLVSRAGWLLRGPFLLLRLCRRRRRTGRTLDRDQASARETVHTGQWPAQLGEHRRALAALVRPDIALLHRSRAPDHVALGHLQRDSTPERRGGLRHAPCAGRFGEPRRLSFCAAALAVLV